MSRFKIRSRVDPKRIRLDTSLRPDGTRRHDYYVDDVRRPGATTILFAEGLQGPSAKFGHNPEAAMLGTARHRAILLYIRKRLDPATIHPEVRPHLDQFISWKERRGVRVIAAEMPVAYPAPCFCGTLDLLAWVKGFTYPVLIDFKTGATAPDWTAFQTALYAVCLTEKVQRGVLHLDGSDREVEVKEYRSPSDAGIALAAATVHAAKLALFGWPKEEE